MNMMQNTFSPSSQSLNDKIQNMWRNWLVSDTFEPGSTFKTITMIAALEEKLVNDNDTFTCNGSVKFGNTNIHCWKHEGHGTQTLAEVLMQRGYKVVSDGTDNHLVLLSLLDKEFSGKDADLALGNAGITVNKNAVPGEIRSPFVTSGVRIGSPALSARGFKEKEFVIVANKIADVLDDIKNTQKQVLIKSELKELAIKFPIYTKAIF